MRLRQINNRQCANDYLQTVFIPEFWQKNIVVKAKEIAPEFTPVPARLNLDDICIQKEYRKIRNDHTFSYGNKFYLIESALKYSLAKQKIEIRKRPGGDFSAYFAGRRLAISEVIEPSKHPMYDLEIQQKLDAIALADELGNVSEAARISGCSRETIYKNRRLLKEKGPLALKRTFCPDKHHKNRTAKEVENVVIKFSLDTPHLGQAQVSAQLKTLYQIDLSPSGIRSIWLREKINTKILRVKKAKRTASVV